MTIRTFLAAAILALSPGFALAQGCESGHVSQQASSCAEGYSWDTATATCVAQINS